MKYPGRYLSFKPDYRKFNPAEWDMASMTLK
jgi:hypothetical protein